MPVLGTAHATGEMQQVQHIATFHQDNDVSKTAHIAAGFRCAHGELRLHWMPTVHLLDMVHAMTSSTMSTMHSR